MARKNGALPTWGGQGNVGVAQANGLNAMTAAIRGVQSGNDQVAKAPEGPDSVGTSEPALIAGIEEGTYVTHTSTDVEVPIYDADDPNTEIGTATVEVYTSITWLIPGALFGVTGSALMTLKMPPTQ